MLDFAEYGLFIWCFVLAAFGGLASLLRSQEPLTISNILKNALNSGLLGLGVSLLWFQVYVENQKFLTGICLLCGLGGMPTVEFVLGVVRRLVVGFTMNAPKGTSSLEKRDEQS